MVQSVIFLLPKSHDREIQLMFVCEYTTSSLGCGCRTNFYCIKYIYPNNMTPKEADDSHTHSGKPALGNNMMFPVLPTIHKMNKQSVLIPCSVSIQCYF